MKKMLKKFFISIFFILFITIDVNAAGAGAKVAIVGDSISSYNGTSSYGTVDYYGMFFYPQEAKLNLSDMWWAKLLNKKGWTLAINESISSTKVTYTPAQKDTYMAGDRRVNALGSKGVPDVILIFGGINDAFDESLSMGSLPSTTGVENNFANSYDTMIKKIKDKYPNAEIVCIVPYMPKYQQNNSVTRIQQLATIIPGIASKYGLESINLQNLNLANEDFCDVGVHPNAIGMQKIADYIASNYKGTGSKGNSSNTGNTGDSGTINLKPASNKTEKLECDSLFGTDTSIGKFLHAVYNIIKFLVPIILIGMSIKDYAGALTSQDGGAIKKATITFGKRLIIAVIILILPTILNFIFKKLLSINTCFL